MPRAFPPTRVVISEAAITPLARILRTRPTGPLAWAVTLTFVATLAALAFPYLLKLALDAAMGRDAPLDLPSIGVVGVALIGVSSIARYLSRGMLARQGEALTLDLRDRVFGALQGLSLTYHGSRAIGDRISRVQYDSGQLQQLVTAILPQTIELAVTVVGTAIVLVALAPKLTLMAFVVVPVAVALALVYRNKIRPLSKEVSRAQGAVFQTVYEPLDGIEDVKVYGGEPHYEERVHEVGARLREVQLRLADFQIALYPAMSFAVSLVLLGVLVVGGYMVRGGGEGAITVGTLAAFYYYVSRSLGPVRGVPNLVLGWHRAMGAVERIDELLDSDERLPRAADPRPVPDGPLELRFEDVHFRYTDPTTDREHLALDGESFTLAPGARVAILGPSGAGKSTTGKLVARLYDPQRGRVLLDGVALPDYELRELRGIIGYVGQEVFLMDASIEQNIRFGAPDCTGEELVRAARTACVDRIADGREDGMDAQVGRRGGRLSGGQRKRVALARSLVRDPRILVVDQLASDLEIELNREIFEGVRRDYDCSILYLGHRIPAGFVPDAVYWMEGGRLRPFEEVGRALPLDGAGTSDEDGPVGASVPAEEAS